MSLHLHVFVYLWPVYCSQGVDWNSVGDIRNFCLEYFVTALVLGILGVLGQRRYMSLSDRDGSF